MYRTDPQRNVHVVMNPDRDVQLDWGTEALLSGCRCRGIIRWGVYTYQDTLTHELGGNLKGKASTG